MCYSIRQKEEISRYFYLFFSGNKLFRAFWGILPLFSEFFSQKLFLPFEKWKLTSRKFRRNIPSYLSIFPNLKIEHHFRKPKNLTKIFLFFSPSKNNTNFFSFFSLFSHLFFTTPPVFCVWQNPKFVKFQCKIWTDFAWW